MGLVGGRLGVGGRIGGIAVGNAVGLDIVVMGAVVVSRVAVVVVVGKAAGIAAEVGVGIVVGAAGFAANTIVEFGVVGTGAAVEFGIVVVSTAVFVDRLDQPMAREAVEPAFADRPAGESRAHVLVIAPQSPQSPQSQCSSVPNPKWTISSTKTLTTG